MQRLLTSILVFSMVSCTSATVRPRAVVFEPPTAAGAEEISREVKSLGETIPVDTFEAHVFQASSGTVLPYRLLRPHHSAAQRPQPLVVIFHGSGAIGTDNHAQIGPVARSWATDEARREFPAFVLIPQFPARTAEYTIGKDSLPHAEGTALLTAAVELVRHVQATESIAKEKTYAIGFSMGGSATWSVLGSEPGLFARAVIVGGVPTADALQSVGGARVLLVHGDEDTENPFAAAWNVFAASDGKIEFWRFRGRGHEFPPELIIGDRMREWLSHRGR